MSKNIDLDETNINEKLDIIHDLLHNLAGLVIFLNAKELNEKAGSGWIELADGTKKTVQDSITHMDSISNRFFQIREDEKSERGGDL